MWLAKLRFSRSYRVSGPDFAPGNTLTLKLV